ncbi:Aldehyde dehydrogenase, dimeric NADP-preferring [Paramyrothecium foliicola]|nr:Aldehyde dehydrogenase, dimeric NADP-preferring [Paramyrothecium foliicola]
MLSPSSSAAVVETQRQQSPFTPLKESIATHHRLTLTFSTGKTKDIRWRKWQLKQLWWLLEDNEQAIANALQGDLSRHETEALSNEVAPLKKDILEHLRKMEEWAADEPIAEAGFIMGRLGKARVRKEPLGVALIIGAWNFPFLLTLQPVIAAISAGCTVLIKPSELSVASQNLMTKLVARYLDPEAVQVVTGGPQETTELLKLKFNHVFFTGSTKVAKYVAASAAKHLTPTVLELGGQGPAIVGQSADCELAAKRIAYVKFLNAGQICLSVNHVFVDPSIHDLFVERLIHWTREFAGQGKTQMCKIVNERNHGRLQELVERSKGTIHHIQCAGKTDATFMSPVVATEVQLTDSLLSEELFGPICPVVKATVAEAVWATNQGPHPLAIYIFSKDRAEIDNVLNSTISGGVTVNDTLLHIAVPGAPFGGVGDSGHGYYHGKHGFMAFTHQRTVLELPTWLEVLLASRYPPFTSAIQDKALFKPSVSFRRGETLQDQTAESRVVLTFWPGLVGVLTTALLGGWLAAGDTYFRELIPPNVGRGSHRILVQIRTLSVWTLAALFGAFVFFQNWVHVSPKTRAAALGLVFPGAGYLASATVLGAVLFVLTWAALPAALFAWFGAGAITFPLLVWGLSVLGAFAATGDSVSSKAGYLAPGLLLFGFFYAAHSARVERAHGRNKRQARNDFIPHQVEAIKEKLAIAASLGDDHELPLEALRKLQHVFDLAFQNLDDWSGFTVIDQFQTAALRYQIYQMMYTLGLYQSTYAPNMHSYVSEAFRRTIERSLTKKVLNFWKWERLLGKFSLYSEPIKQDNIMVTGFLFHGVMLYTANTGDLRYTKPGSLVFNVDDNAVHKYCIQDLQQSLLRQWSASPYCLIPCEPNWIYVMCNLQGLNGAVLYDRVFGTKDAEQILPMFEESLHTNFSETSGSVLPIRSELVGFTIPGICGAIGDLAAATMGTGPLPHLARRLWAIVRSENIEFDAKTKVLSVKDLVGADKIDPGNYKPSEHAIYTSVASVAAEMGDMDIADAARRKFEDAWGLVTTDTGATSLNPSKASTLQIILATTGALLRPGSYHRMVREGPPKKTLDGPILSEVPYPGVLVAKARSHTSRDLELVLYPSSDPGSFELVVSRLGPDKEYIVQGNPLLADGQGHLRFSVMVNGRVHLHIKPVGTS